jgi:hypothetical protein
MKRRGQVLQPVRLNRHVVVRECQNVTLSLPNPGIASMGQALLWLKHVTEATGVPAAEILYNLPRLVGRVVIHYDYFPFE